MSARRVLIAGASTHWGGRLAQAIESDPAVETVIGVDTGDPTCELQRTEFIRTGFQRALLRRIVEAARIDTVVDTRSAVDPAATASILAACAGPDSPVRKLVFESSAHCYGCERDDPAFFTEEMRRSRPPRSERERAVVDGEAAVAAFAARESDVVVTVLRFADGIGPELESSHMRLLSLPAVPAILGFDPRCQFIHEDDVVGCLRHSLANDLPGTFNCAADGVLALSEVAGLLAKPLVPVLPPLATGLAAAAVRRLGLRIPPELVQQLRHGRGLDNRLFKATGYYYRHTTREAVLRLAEYQRVAPVRDEHEPYRYERDVEEFLRRSPSVRG